jgi:glutathione S-transferase
MDQVMSISDWYLFQGVTSVIGFERVVGPRLIGHAPNEARISDAVPKARVVFKALSAILGDQPFFAGDAVSLADLLVVPQMDFMAQTPEWAPLTAEAANLVPWLARMSGRRSVQTTTWDEVAAMAAAS